MENRILSFLDNAYVVALAWAYDLRFAAVDSK